MIYQFTEEDINLLYQVRDEYLEKVCTYVEPDHDKITKWVHWLYKLHNLPVPDVKIVGTFEDAQAIRRRCTIRNKEVDILGDTIGSPDTSQYFTDYISDWIRWEVMHPSFKRLVCEFKEESAPYRGHVLNVTYADYYWVAEWEFYYRIKPFKTEQPTFKQIMDLGIWDTSLFSDLCIVITQPFSIKKYYEIRQETRRVKSLLTDEILKADRLFGEFVKRFDKDE